MFEGQIFQYLTRSSCVKHLLFVYKFLLDMYLHIALHPVMGWIGTLFRMEKNKHDLTQIIMLQFQNWLLIH